MTLDLHRRKPLEALIEPGKGDAQRGDRRVPTATLSFRRTAPLTAPTNRPAVTGDDEPDIAGWEVMAPSRGWLLAMTRGV